MKHFATLALILFTAACASGQRFDPAPAVHAQLASAAAAVTSDPSTPTVTPEGPLDLFGQARRYLNAHPDQKAFVLADLHNSLDMATAANEPDGMTCLPTFIACVNGDATVCGESAKVTGLFSLHEAAILGVPVKQYLVPKKFHHDCAAWLMDRNVVGAALTSLLPLH